MQIVRWGLALSWLLLIASLFYDPISSILTDPGNLQSPLRIHPETCILLQGECLVQKPYSLGVRIFWSAIVPAAIFVIFVFGHDVWRRMCPLSFFSQLPRALKWQRQRKSVESGIVRYEVVTISADSWLGKNHLYVQFGLFFVGLTARLLVVNSNPIALGIFLIVTILSAMLVGFLYAGKSWCNYFCPFSPVQAVFTGPRGLLGSSAHQQSETGVSQSMCRTADNESACVGCKSPCIDIDAEQAYWENLEKPARRFVQYGYVGILIAFFGYFYLFAGNWDYYFSGAWSRDDAIGTLFNPGFYLLEQAIPLPKLIAVPLTLAMFTVLSYLILSQIEKSYRGYLRQQRITESRQRSHHVMFTLVTVFSFWFFFCFAGRPILNTLPSFVSLGFNAIVTVAGSLWVYRTWGRTQSQYESSPNPDVQTQIQTHIQPEDITESARKHLERSAVVDGDRLQFKPRSSDDNTTLVKAGDKTRSNTTQTRRK
jgi:polyferredoxin